MFEKNISNLYGNVAVVCNDKEYTYDELQRLIDQYAIGISRITNGTAKVIALYLDRGIDYIALVWAILKCGCTYLPIDKEFPNDRIYDILDGCANLVITDIENEFIQSMVETVFIKQLLIKSNGSYLDCNNDIVYIIFTSGSTGKPKGVQISHKALYSFVLSFPERIDFANTNCMLAVSSTSFDISFVEIFLPLLYGKKVILASELERRNPRKIWRIINKYHPDTIQMTPSYLKYVMLCNHEAEDFLCVNKLIVGGERISELLIKKLQKYKQLRIFNAYGPTEATIWCFVAEVTSCDYEHVGTPLQNTQYIISDNDELLIGGECLFSGYYNDDEKTDEKTMIIDGVCYYHSGDCVRQSDKGEIIISGRIDHQVKIDGHRVELEDIECNIKSKLGLEDCAVTYHNNELVFHYVGTEEFSRKRLYSSLSDCMPAYMIPTVCNKLDFLPMNTNGKVDRLKLLNSR